jgi:DNA-binding LacI/PurR family transcriptional regulator
MAEAGLSDSGLIVFGDFGRVSAEHAVYRLLDRRPGLDAVFVASDLMAAGALRVLRRGGRLVPDDVVLIGFGDSPLARHTDPKLTTRAPAGGGHGRATRERTARADRAGRPGSHALGA